ncbi:MAG TPA: dihydroorotate dehydrogenase electron transfer subunit [Blastocatellia bacterium]|jgi:dihydroorotate dehydrogenase electron transfer subunit|nr:dihydroorotate dehydrogenase electron transfer subunit [Blastocatellia bacterium]
MIDTVTTVERNDLILPEPDGGSGGGSGRMYGYLRLRLDREIPVLPGQFAMIKPHGIAEPLLRRAMAYYRSMTAEGAPCVDFIYQILGRGTRALANLRPEDKVDFLGSLGNTYDIEAARGREALLVAGGVGSAALFMLAEELVRRDARVKLFIGGASRGDLCGLGDFIGLLREENVICATVDGSLGEASFVTAPLERHLQRGSGARTIIYACGPDPMLHRVAQIAERFGAPSQLSLEAPMGCGYGVCVGCAVAVRDDCPEGFVYKKACVDGPIFWGEELYW